MLLFEQKTGLFDSVDQYRWPVSIISAMVDVKDQAAILELKKNAIRESQSLVVRIKKN